MDPLDEIPEKVLGYKVKTRWQIAFYYLIPCVVELMVYVSLTIIDAGVAWQHWIDRNRLFAMITIIVILVPAILTFLCVMLSDQWPEKATTDDGTCCCGCNKEKWTFFGRQLVNLIFFPFCAIYRFSRKIFWCVESLFHDKNSYERHQAVTKAAEHSPFELYHFLQSFFHSAPQVILQLFVLLREDSFRNYDTAFLQSLSVVFGLIKMAMTVESFQRFESRKLIGKTYPWLAPHQVDVKSSAFRRTLSAPVESETSRRNNEQNNQKLLQDIINYDVNVKSMRNDDVNNFDDSNNKKIMNMPEKMKNFQSNITDDDKIQAAMSSTSIKVENHPNIYNSIPDDDLDLVENIQEIKEYLRSMESIDYVEINEDHKDFDQVPTLPPPPRPTSTKHPYLEKLHRISQYKDMLLMDAENFIKQKVPRLPAKYFEHQTNEKEIKTSPQPPTPTSPTKSFNSNNNNDEVDAVLLPTRRLLVDGIEDDDIVAKFISFLGWMMFLFMRMISISVFAVFYPDICGYICLSHYFIMLIALINETRFQVRWQRTTFYIILAYIFIFNLMEFKVKFQNIRRWYIWYFIFVFIQNIAMTVAWYGFTEFLDTWWFEFMFLSIIQSGIMSLMCFILYFYYLKPKEKIFQLQSLDD